MIATLRKYTFLILIILFTACQEVYYPDDIDANLNIPVIEGYIHDGPGPYKVELFWATAFNEQKNDPIINARIIISDNYGNSELLTEASNGRYFSKQEGIRGTAGRIYTLRVELKDGSIYESIPILMQTPDEIDTVYAEVGEKDYIEKNYYGELIITRRKGLYVYVDINTGHGNNRFFRFYNRLISQSYYAIYVKDSPDPIYVYCWKTGSLDDIVNAKSTINNNTEQVIKRHNLGFLPYIYNPTPLNDTTSAIFPTGWIVSTTAYTITEDAYEYYNSMVKQLSAEERIFDPIPSQIKGNIRCLSDTNKLVLGLFEVASKSIRHTALNWSTGRKTYDIINLSTYSAPASNSCQDSIMPDFWITFQ